MGKNANGSTLRAFIAIDLPEDIQEQLSKVAHDLKCNLGEEVIRWVPIQNIHLTLKFLGNVPLRNLGVLEQILSDIAHQHQPFRIQIGGLGAFPKIRAPRVIWIGVENSPELIAVQKAVDRETARLGYPSEGRAYSAHLTLGRVSRHATSHDIERIANYLMEYKTPNVLGSMLVRELLLFRSDLIPSGAIYTRLFTAVFQSKDF